MFNIISGKFERLSHAGGELIFVLMACDGDFLEKWIYILSGLGWDFLNDFNIMFSRETLSILHGKLSIKRGMI